MNSNLSYAIAARDQAIIEWVKKGYKQWMDLKDPGRTGIVVATELCQIADMIQVGLMMSRNGIQDCWEDVDRLVRNSIASMQITQADVDRVRSQPIVRAGDPNNTKILKAPDEPVPIPLNKPLPPGFHQPEDATDRCWGAWFVTLENRGASIGCCNGNMSRALYLLADSIIEAREDLLKVNLLMNRATQWADLDSYLPFEGRCVIRIKAGREKLLVRVPEWTDRGAVSCAVNGRQRAPLSRASEQGYLGLGPVAAEETVEVKFPIKKWVIDVSLPVTPKADKKQDCRITMKANTVLDIEGDTRYPLQTRERYRADRAATRKVARFVSHESFPWW